MELRLYRPLRSKRISQRFGENSACIHTQTGRVVSARGGNCGPGYEPLYGSMGLLGHNGYDMPAFRGEGIYHCANFNGWLKTERDLNGGIGVDVISDEPIFFKEGDTHVKVRYWHLKSPIGWDGKKVRTGDVIGLANNTGLSSGDHLHWSVKQCDEKGKALYPNNGYYGCFDQTPYYNNDLFAPVVASPIKGKKLPIGAVEQQEMRKNLSILRSLLLALRELLAKN